MTTRSDIEASCEIELSPPQLYYAIVVRNSPDRKGCQPHGCAGEPASLDRAQIFDLSVLLTYFGSIFIALCFWKLFDRHGAWARVRRWVAAFCVGLSGPCLPRAAVLAGCLSLSG